MLRHVRAAFARAKGWLSRPDMDAELREELEAHMEMEAAEYVRRGMSPAAARRRAMMASGGVTQAAEAVRDQRGLPWLDGLLSDLRYAVRALRHSRAFTIIVVATLALGIGANTAIFSVVRGVLLKPLPHRDGDRLVYLRHSADGPGQGSLTFSVPEVRDLRNGVPSLAGLAEYSQWVVVLQGRDGAERIDAALVTGNYFEVMGLSPVLGRLTTARDDGAAAAPVAVLSYEAWQTRYGGDSSIVGTQVRIDKRPVTVIGVLQRAPFFPEPVEVLLNMVVSDHHLSASMVEGRTHRMTEVIGRLAAGASLRDARREVAAVYARMLEDHPEAYDTTSHYRVAVMPFREALGERARLTVLLLMAAAGFVLIISVANVANLTLMRGVRREHELVVRAALGAGVGRLRRLLLAENLLLTLGGAAIGVAIALGGVRLLTAFAARYSPRASEIRVDAVVLGFMLALAAVIALVLSFVAALPREGTFSSGIGAAVHRMSGGLRRHRLQRVLVVAQVAVSVMLLAGAGLLTRTLIHLSQVETGLRTEEILTMQVPLMTPSELLFDPTADTRAKLDYERMRQEIAALPGVTEVGVGSPMPLRSSDVRFEVKTEERPIAPGEAAQRAELRIAGPEFFRAAGIPLVRGRGFLATDRRGAERVVVLNEVLAARLFPGADPIGKRVAWTGEVMRFTPISTDWRTVVGVAATTRDGGPDAEPRPAMYMPLAQELAIGGGLVIRADSNVAAIAPAATRIVRRIAPTAPLVNVMTLRQFRDRTIAPRRLNAILISSFGVLALLIASVGIAGVLAFSVSARTTEIGIRMSLGAERSAVTAMIMREGGRLLLAGLALGVGGALLTTGALRGLLFDVAPRDPLTFGGVAVVMVVIGLLACWIPARRAARIDPVLAMRAP